MLHMKLRLAAILLAFTVMVVFNFSSLAVSGDGNAQVPLWLRNDLPDVNNAQNYMMALDPASPLPSVTRPD